MKSLSALFLSTVFLSLSGANLIPGDTSAETERATAGNGKFGAMVYGHGNARLAWDRSDGFDGKSSLKTMTPDVFSLKKSVKLRKGVQYTFFILCESKAGRCPRTDQLRSFRYAAMADAGRGTQDRLYHRMETVCLYLHGIEGFPVFRDLPGV